MALFKWLWVGEACRFERIMVRYVRRGNGNAFCTKINDILHDVNCAVGYAEETGIYFMNCPWGQAALTK